MPFQFLCPQGHLLQGIESQAGQRCKCPYCDIELIVPYPPGMAPPQDLAPPQPVEPQPVYSQPPQEEEVPVIRAGYQPEADLAAAASVLPQAAPGDIVHVICPEGHQLETPRDMLGQDAMCPYCQTIFRLRFEDTLEYLRAKEEERERRELKAGRTWMLWSFAIAAMVLVGVVVLAILASAD